MGFLKDLRSPKQKETQVPAVVVPEAPPKPANALEQMVNEALPIPVQLKKTEDQLRQDALQTMTYLEAARQEKGNFCLTLGEGDKRAILLVAPVEGIKAEDFIKKSSYGQADYTYSATRIDYVLLTAEGPRRISFLQADPNPLYQGDQLKTRNDQEVLKEKNFKGIVDRLVKKGEVNLKDSAYQEWVSGNGNIDVTLSIGIPGSSSDSDKFRMNTTRYNENDFANSSVSGVITEDATPLQAVKNSLNSVQSPLQAQMANARAQIQSVNAIRQGLK